MAYDYIGLVNDINRRLNEVEITEVDFPTVTGYYSFAKDAVNSAIRHINQEEFEWPWNHVEATETTSPGVVRYSYPYDAKTVDMDSFRIVGDDTLGVTTARLKVLSYEEYLDKYIDSEYNSTQQKRSVPRFVVRSPSRELLFVPSPDKSYDIVYEYYTLGYDLNNARDIPSLPEQFRHVIVDGAMYYVYMFRGDMQASQLSLQQFEAGIKNLRSLHINRTEYLRDTRVRF